MGNLVFVCVGVVVTNDPLLIDSSSLRILEKKIRNRVFAKVLNFLLYVTSLFFL